MPAVAVRTLAALLLALSALLAAGCRGHVDAGTAVLIIESSPANLDPRVGTDAQSERIDKLLYDALLTRDEHFNLRPALAESWQQTDPLTLVFHLRRGVLFHDGHVLASADVKYTFDSILSGKIRSPKTSTYASVLSVEAPDAQTVVFHLREADASLPWNLSDGAIGIVEQGTPAGATPVGTGPFRFVSATQDRDVVIARNDSYWGQKPRLPRVRFLVVPDATTRALELRKGSADAAINALTPDTVLTLEHDPRLAIERAPGTIYTYLAMNLRDPVLRDVRVRQALALAIDRQSIIDNLWHGMARPAASVLPPQHWAFDPTLPQLPHDVARARQLLDAAGYKPGTDGVRFHLTMKTSTEETTRLLAAVLQQQLREAGIALDIRSYEFATFYADVTHGSFQLFSLRWIGGNEDPDIYENIFASASTPPRRNNRGFYASAEMDSLLAAARRSTDQNERAALYRQVQQLAARDLPYINLWYLDNVLVHTRRLTDVRLDPAGSYDFLRTARLQP
jgi:peptide/nickel transport system substrate-binding protein